MNLKSDRLRKLESELEDLQQWMKLGLVPKKDVEKHKEEIISIKGKIDEEKERLRFIKETGDTEEYAAPKKSASKPYAEPQTLPDMEVNTEADFEVEETDTFFGDTVYEEGEEESSGKKEDETLVEEEDPFSDRNRWKRGVMEDPDADNW